MTRATYRVNADKWTKLVDILVADPEEFNGEYGVDKSGQFPRYRNAFRGRKMNVGRLSQLGQLPDEWRAKWRQDKGEIDYVIYSYETPIAWRVSDTWYGNHGQTHSHRWVMPNVKYSLTTSKHQGKVRTALSQISGGL